MNWLVIASALAVVSVGCVAVSIQQVACKFNNTSHALCNVIATQFIAIADRKLVQ